MLDRDHFERLDLDDPLTAVTARFHLPDGVVYLDGNSLGPLPAHVSRALARVVDEEWGEGLIRSWNRGWWELAGEVGDVIGGMIGAPAGTVIAGDTTTAALFKTTMAALRLRPSRPVILTDSGNFPTDLYVLEAAAGLSGASLEVVGPHEVEGRIGDDVAVVALTHVDYRTGRRHDLAAISEAAHRAGSLVVWDLSHSAGAMEIDIACADMAVGCGYKYLNGGPGAPAFTYVSRDLLPEFTNPISGWWGHREPFAMRTDFEPAPGIERTQVGTPPVISLAALRSALEVFEGVPTRLLREKSERLVGDFVRLVDERLDGFQLVTPRRPEERGSHVALSHPRAREIMAALISEGVIGDVRPPHLLRFGLAPAFQRHVDVWDAVEAIRRVMDNDLWRSAVVPSGPVT